MMRIRCTKDVPPRISQERDEPGSARLNTEGLVNELPSSQIRFDPLDSGWVIRFEFIFPSDFEIGFH